MIQNGKTLRFLVGYTRLWNKEDQGTRWQQLRLRSKHGSRILLRIGAGTKPIDLLAFLRRTSNPPWVKEETQS
ncbi:MAG: hypothetical protein AAGJ31_04825, partial [Verrucomicrobiota bacterium]